MRSNVCDACQVLRQTYGLLASSRRHRIVPLRDRSDREAARKNTCSLQDQRHKDYATELANTAMGAANKTYEPPPNPEKNNDNRYAVQHNSYIPMVCMTAN